MKGIEKQLAETKLELRLMCIESNLLERKIEELKKLLNERKGLNISQNLLDKLTRTKVNGHPAAHNSIYETPSVLSREVSCRGYNEIDRELFEVLNGVEDDSGILLAQEHKMVNHDSFYFVLGSSVVVT